MSHRRGKLSSGARSRSLGEVALHSQLEAAHQRIFNLEDLIRDRDRQVTSGGGSSRYRHGEDTLGMPPAYAMQRRRRTGRTQDMLMTLSRSSIDEDHLDHTSILQSLQAPLSDFVCLRLVKVLTSDDDLSLPFILRRLIGREYHIGPDGTMIGTSFNCDIQVPAEGEVCPEHCRIKYVSNSPTESEPRHKNGHFVLIDLASGRGSTYVTHNGYSLEAINEEKEGVTSMTAGAGVSSGGAVFPLNLSHGVRFVTGRFVWDLIALPEDVVFRAKIFHLAEQKHLPQMQEMLKDQTAMPRLAVIDTKGVSVWNNSIPISFDVNLEYKPPVYESDESFLALRKGSERISVVTPPTAIKAEKASLLLHVAINNGDIKMVKYLLSLGANVNKCSGSLQYSAVHLAASNNNSEVMKELMEHGADLEARNVENLTPLALTTSYDIRKMILNSILLCAAADAGDIAEVTRLLATDDISPNVKGLRHKSSLHLAAFKGYSEILELLILNRGNVNQKGGSRQRTPLHYAGLGGHGTCIQLLLNAGAQEYIRDIGGYTPLNLCKGDACRLLNKQPLSLCLAVQSGNVENVSNILEDMQLESENQNLIDLRNENGHTPLHLASITGSLLIAQVLVSFDATVDIIGGKENWTPLFYAAMAGHADLVEFFLSVGSNPDTHDRQGNTLKELMMKEIEETKERMNRLKQRERSESVVETTFLARLSVNMLRQESSSSCSVESELLWQTAKLTKLYQILPMLTSFSEKLSTALDAGNLSDFMSILDSDSNNSSHSFTDLSPILLQACEDGLITFVKALLDYGLKPCVQGLSNEIPLLVAAKNGEVNVVKLLIEYGVDPNTQSTDSQSSALHEAASMNELATVKYLLSVGSNKDLINSSGEKPFDCSDMLEIQKLLASGPNLLLVAASNNDPETITNLIVERGINVDHQFHQTGHSALHQACMEGLVEVVQVLLRHNANINLQGGVTFSTPLHIASGRDHLEVAKLLLSNGARVDLKNVEGKVPFEVAISNKMRKVLVESRLIKPCRPSIHASLSREESKKLCVICMDKPINTIVLPCGHQSFCVDCVTQLNECALDRKPIKEIVPVYN